MTKIKQKQDTKEWSVETTDDHLPVDRILPFKQWQLTTEKSQTTWYQATGEDACDSHFSTRKEWTKRNNPNIFIHFYYHNIRGMRTKPNSQFQTILGSGFCYIKRYNCSSKAFPLNPRKGQCSGEWVMTMLQQYTVCLIINKLSKCLANIHQLGYSTQ